MNALLTGLSIRCPSGKYQISCGQATRQIELPFDLLPSFPAISAVILFLPERQPLSFYIKVSNLFLFIVYWISSYTTQLPGESRLPFIIACDHCSIEFIAMWLWEI